MTSSPQRRRFLRTGLGLGAALAVPAARACDFFTVNLRIDHVWTRATGDDRVAVVCMTFDDVTLDDRLIGAQTPMAEGAEIGGPLARPTVDFFIPRGQTTVLAESASHLRLTGLKRPLELGRSYPLTLVFQRGGAVSADIDVDYERLAAAPSPRAG